jgi:hypothetical protein
MRGAAGIEGRRRMSSRKNGNDTLDCEARHRLLDELVFMYVAATWAHARTTGRNVKATEPELDRLAQTLARLATLYSVSEDRKSIVALGPHDTHGGRFKMAGKVMEFRDGRSALIGLAMTLTSLNEAIDRLNAGTARDVL